MRRWQLAAVHGQLLLTSMIWGGHFVALRAILRELRVTDGLLLRCLIASGCYLLLLCWLAQREGRFPRIRREDWRQLVIVGFLGGPASGLGVMWAQRYISADVSSLVTTINPIFTAILAYFLLGQALTRRQVGGILLAIVGFLTILFLGGKGAQLEIRNVIGVLLMASSPTIWAFYTVLSKSLVNKYPATHFTAYSMIVGTLILTPLGSPRFVREVAHLSQRAWAGALFSGLLALFVSYLLWNTGLKALQPAQVAVYIYLVPVFGVIAAAVFLGDRLTVWSGIGGAAILAGVIVTNTGTRRTTVTGATVGLQEASVGRQSGSKKRLAWWRVGGGVGEPGRAPRGD